MDDAPAGGAENQISTTCHRGRPRSVPSGQDREHGGQTLIVSTGASAKMLGLESEKKLLGRGVSTCATCDGFFFKGQELIVAGGGDSAMEEAIFLTKFARRVTVVHRRESLRASKIMQERARRKEKIAWVWNSTIDEVLDVAQGKVTGSGSATCRPARSARCRSAASSWRSAHLNTSSRARSSWTGRVRRHPAGLDAHQRAGVFAGGDVADTCTARR
jgi:thioredoxin reductase